MKKRYLENILLQSIKVFPAVGILGPRQTGKTTLANALRKKLKKNSIYLDMENPDDVAKLQNPTIFFGEYSNECVIIDEVQRVPHLFPVLRSIIDKKRISGRFILLGSASPNLLLKSSESLAGRIIYHELTPFIYEEVKDTIQIDNLLIRGGYPTALLAKKNADVILWHRSFIQTYIERDLPALGLSLASNSMLRLMQMISHVHSNILNYSQLAKSLGVSSPTITNALNYLENAYLIRRLPAYHFNIKKRLVKAPKLYVRDSGIICHLLRISSKKEFIENPSSGAIWEGFVIEQVITYLGPKYEYCYYRTQDGTEMDLVILKSGRPYISIEVKYSSAPKITQGTYQSITDLKTKKNFLITPAEEKGYYTAGKELMIIGFASFCNDILPKM